MKASRRQQRAIMRKQGNPRAEQIILPLRRGRSWGLTVGETNGSLLCRSRKQINLALCAHPVQQYSLWNRVPISPIPVGESIAETLARWPHADHVCEAIYVIRRFLGRRMNRLSHAKYLAITACLQRPGKNTPHKWKLEPFCLYDKITRMFT